MLSMPLYRGTAVGNQPMKRKGVPKPCRHCGRHVPVAASLGVCRNCILDDFDAVEARIAKAHARVRSDFGLPTNIPKTGVQCTQCVNMCMPDENELGFCGIREAKGGAVRQVDGGAILEWYYDPLPTNCVADFVCPSGTGDGYPGCSGSKSPGHGRKNLAVFYGACNFSCLFCQNWQYRKLTKARGPVMTAEELAGKADRKTSCICYFGGDPSPQIEHSIRTSEITMARDHPVRICYETNGSMNRRYFKRIAELSYESGGCVKIDLKAWNATLSKALCGTDNSWTLNNFRWLADYQRGLKDRGIPLLIASTLMIPGYVEKEEVSQIAGFIASLDDRIPYSLLAFSPNFEMKDLPLVNERIATECVDAAKDAGLRNVRLGNAHLID